MVQLKLHTFEEEAERDPDILPFPQEVIADENSPAPALDLADRIEQSLDDLQRRIDKVKDEIDSAYRFPGPEDWPPHSAA